MAKKSAVEKNLKRIKLVKRFAKNRPREISRIKTESG